MAAKEILRGNKPTGLRFRSLNRNGPEKSAGQWWAFEGFTEVDCCLQTDKLVLLIEGNLEAARDPA